MTSDTEQTAPRASQYSYEDLLACGRGELFGAGNAQLPLPPMLMFDRITEIGAEGGAHGVVRQHGRAGLHRPPQQRERQREAGRGCRGDAAQRRARQPGPSEARLASAPSWFGISMSISSVDTAVP